MKWAPEKPNPAAAARVKHPVPIPRDCHICGGAVHLVNNSEIYGRPFGNWPWAYRCQMCGASVGLHPETDIPLGRVADNTTKKARLRAKKEFMKLYRSRLCTRTRAYRLLADRMHIAAAECHFGLFDYEQSRTAEVAAKEILNDLRKG